jgi:hypothetical protein
MRVMGLDPAKGFGWACYDRDKPPSSIISGSLRLDGMTILDKLTDLRTRLVPIVKEFRPDFVGIESPFKFAPRYKKQPPKNDLFANQVVKPPDEEYRLKEWERAKVLELVKNGDGIYSIAENLAVPVVSIQSMFDETINPMTISDLGQIAGCATGIVLCWNARCQQIPPRSWQVVIPSRIHVMFAGEGAPKKRAKHYCDELGIISPNIDSRDAALIALHTANKAQEVKMLARGAA